MEKAKFIEIMDIAIKSEIEAHEFYKKVAERVEDKSVKKIFQDLAEDELGHRELLEKYKFNPDMPMKFQAPQTDFHLAEEMELPALTTEMKPADALALAMKKEQYAVTFYQKLAAQTDDEQVKMMLLEIANMELNHKQNLENAYTDIAYVEAF
jgi:rubrerythrin